MSLSELPIELKENILVYRKEKYQCEPGNRIHKEDEAVDFVNKRGFIFFWPIKNATLPSLWVAAAGDRPVPNNHDDPGHITWSWKDNLLDKKKWYYGKHLKRKSTIISLEAAPYFYALSQNFGDYQNDYLDQYKEGHLSSQAKQVYESLLNYGQLDTLTLREKSNLTSRSSTYKFQRALEVLQTEMKILPIGISPVGHFKYSYKYDIVPRYFADIENKAKELTPSVSRKFILEKYMLSVGAARLADMQKFFRFNKAIFDHTVAELKSSRTINITKNNKTEKFLILKTLL